MSIEQQYLAIALIGLWAVWLLLRRFGWLPTRAAGAKKTACGGGACSACTAPGAALDTDEMSEQLRQG